MGSAERNYPIAVMAFNRPDYLKQVLDSLLQQQGVDLNNRQITLFQDGGFNEFSGSVRAEPSDVAASVAAFRERFPAARVEHSPTNLGVALNFDRVERWAFEKLAADAAIFLEDDTVLSPHYIRTIDRMLDMAMEDQRIGYVAAYGDWTRPLAK
jgi:GT2 family glycosyltransferase